MNKAEAQHLSRVAELGCIACYLIDHKGTPAEIHHPRAGTGMGQRSKHFDAIPLCPMHHRGTVGLSVPSIHGSKRAFIAAFGTEAELLAKVRELLGIEQ